MRGPLRVGRTTSCHKRLIPAGAGTTARLKPRCASISAHPRRCGDHLFACSIEIVSEGSSPQVRGPLKTLSFYCHQPRLIPAGAGTTPRVLRPGGAPRAHPRRCGDHANVASAMIRTGGSSPQVRGPPLGRPFQNLLFGLIPAGAGTTLGGGAGSSAYEAHPRRCGDHVLGGIPSFSAIGSSPQVRGPHALSRLERLVFRLIPAGAGTTHREMCRCRAGRAHPRRCGDHKYARDHNMTIKGSSPQVRGPLSSFRFPPKPAGLIPAGAGTTGSITRRGGVAGAHPRRCGDHLGHHPGLRRPRGSSPQVRGPQKGT